MNKRVLLGIVCSCYFAIAVLTYAGINTDLQWRCHNEWPHICDQDVIYNDRGLATIFAIFPPLWMSGFLATGFYPHGFSFSAYPDIAARGNR